MKKIFLIFVSAILLSEVSLAQTSTSSSGLIGFRRGLATVMFAGLGGAILGLSTLSFYGEPQEHIGNIWAGLAIGAFGGTAYVFSQSQRSAATASMDMGLPPKPVARTHVPMFQYTWEF